MPQVAAATLTEQAIKQPTAEHSNRKTFILPFCSGCQNLVVKFTSTLLSHHNTCYIRTSERSGNYLDLDGLRSSTADAASRTYLLCHCPAAVYCCLQRPQFQ
jgi:hypothetical protein